MKTNDNSLCQKFWKTSKALSHSPTHKSLMKKLKTKYEDDIIITSRRGKNKPPVICFRNTGYKILTQSWYDSRNVDEKGERLRIVKATAAIIRVDIRSVIYPLDTYPKVD